MLMVKETRLKLSKMVGIINGLPCIREGMGFCKNCQRTLIDSDQTITLLWINRWPVCFFPATVSRESAKRRPQEAATLQSDQRLNNDFGEPAPACIVAGQSSLGSIAAENAKCEKLLWGARIISRVVFVYYLIDVCACVSLRSRCLQSMWAQTLCHLIIDTERQWKL